MRKKMKQLMGILLSLVMVLGLVPGMSLTAYANGTTYNPASTYTGFDELITNDTEVTISEVSGKTWYVIANYSSTVTLLSKQSFGSKAFNSSGTGNVYATSEIKTYVDGLKGTGQPLAGISSVISDLTLIDITTAEGLSETKRKGAGADWWLCTRGSDASEAAFVNGGSGTVRRHGYSVNQRLGVRPALKLNLSSVIFSSVNLSGGANATASGGSIIQNYFDVGTTRSSMTAVTYTANSGYKFPETSDYYTTTNGIKVERTSDTVVTVSGRPTANTNITIPDAHAHSFTYSASGATITATCTADGCDLPEVESKHVATLTIAANGGTYDGTTAYGATITDANSIQGDAKVQYQKKTDGSYGTATEIATTDAGEYKASITVGGATASVEYTITQADSTANAPTGLTATYGQTLADVPLEGKNPEGNTPGTWAWADSTKSVGNVVSPAATFKANFTPTSSNYKTVENVNVRVTVGKADPTAPTGLTATIGQTLANVTLPDGWTWADSTQSVGNVVDPAATFKANFTGNDNYNAASNVDVTVTVGKANAVAATVTANNRTYDGTEKPLVTVTGEATGGEMQYALGTATEATEQYTTSIPAKTEAGTYYVWYKIVGDKDHSDSTAKCVPAKIFEKLERTVTFKVVNGTWDDGTKSDQIVPLEGSEIDIPKLPSDKIPRAGSKPDDGYKEGAWDEVPVAGTEITKDRTYTYSYIEKDTITKTVTFKVVNGAWDDGATDDKPVTLTGKAGDVLKLTQDQIPAAGKKPNEGYKDGSWDVTPNTETAITENTTYTYTYASKESISRTVTFKVVNGSWDDGDAADKTVTLTGKEGDVLKLAQDQIPAAGKKPNEGYKKGYWDVTPNTETAITADTTYTYKYVSETQEEQTRVEPKSMEEYVISDELKNNTVYTSKEIIEASLRTELHVETEEQANNYSLFDAVLVVSFDDGKTWVEATADNFPEGGILAKFGFPTAADGTQTNGQEYTFKLAHLVETTVGTTKAGTIETPEVTVTEDGLSATLMGLSPVIISWEKKTPVPTEVEITLSAAEMSVTQGREKAITATTKPEGTAVTWSSSDKSVATVDGMGVVTGIKPGTATITAKITVEGAEYTANCKVTVIPASTPMPIPVPSGSKGGGEHTHNYVWKTIEATEDADGELRYQCETCGDIQTRLPLTAYNVFNKNTTEKIRKANKDATVKIETSKWISFHKMVMEALAERPDVTLEISFLDEGHKGNRCTVTIPKGTDTMSLVDKNGFTGFLFLGGKFGMKTQ